MKTGLVAACALLICGFSEVSLGQVVTVPAEPVVGSQNPVTAEPPVARPPTRPCTVTLFNNLEFGGAYSRNPLSYAPPARCSGPWAKVVLTIDFTVTAKPQSDYTASVYLGNANIYLGKTAQASNTLSPSWHVERDVTDLSAIFKEPQSGQAFVDYYVDPYASGIYGTARLQFYPADSFVPAPVVPDVVIPLNGDVYVYEGAIPGSEVTTTFTAPRNTVKAYLDVISQGEDGEEYWYFCAPTALKALLDTCGHTAFRETEVTIDGKPAGVAPLFPWLYPGARDGELWAPITGVQALNFKPYRVDLTPFAGVLSDGAPHTLGLSVFNANIFFAETANLLLYEDHFSRETGGELLENTLSAAPAPQVFEDLTTDSTGLTTGTVTVQSTRNFTVKGYVNTSLGRVETTVEQQVAFDSSQLFNISPNEEIQNAAQTSTVTSKTTEKLGPITRVTTKNISFPLMFDFTNFGITDGPGYQTITSNQQDVESETQTVNGFPIYSSSMDEQMTSTDGPSKTASSASYVSKDSLGQCYSRKLTSVSTVLTGVTDTAACHHGR